jgi:predicted peptidase
VISGFAACLLALATAPETGFLDRTVTVEGRGFPYQVYVPRDYSPQTRWPVILFLHGAGEGGTDGVFQTAVGIGEAIRREPARYPAIVVFPQSPKDARWVGTPAQAALAALDRTLEEFHTDARRVYLTGLSMGGHGSWYLAYRHPGRFAAIVPICGWIYGREDSPDEIRIVPPEDGPPIQAVARRLAKVPIWIFHGERDTIVPVSGSREIAAALQGLSAPARYTEFLGVGHESWDGVYASEEFTRWLFAQRRP